MKFMGRKVPGASGRVKSINRNPSNNPKCASDCIQHKAGRHEFKHERGQKMSLAKASPYSGVGRQNPGTGKIPGGFSSNSAKSNAHRK